MNRREAIGAMIALPLIAPAVCAFDTGYPYEEILPTIMATKGDDADSPIEIEWVNYSFKYGGWMTKEIVCREETIKRAALL